jgi:transcriptional regulator of acetoin/glycerol metabolism
VSGLGGGTGSALRKGPVASLREGNRLALREGNESTLREGPVSTLREGPASALRESPVSALRAGATERVCLEFERCGRSVSRTSRSLGISRTTVYRHLREAGDLRGPER